MTRTSWNKGKSKYGVSSKLPNGKKNPEYVRASYHDPNHKKRHYNKYKERERGLKKLYNGLTIDAWNTMFEGQGKVCKGCGRDKPGHKHGWFTDHDHKTGEIRGILCAGCNQALGGARDNPQTLRDLANYLERK